MKVSKFRSDLTIIEGGKKRLNVGDVGEVLHKANAVLGGALYAAIRDMPADADLRRLWRLARRKNRAKAVRCGC